MTANAILGVIGTMLGGVACFLLGYFCALWWVIAELERMRIDRDGHDNKETVAS